MWDASTFTLFSRVHSRKMAQLDCRAAGVRTLLCEQVGGFDFGLDLRLILPRHRQNEGKWIPPLLIIGNWLLIIPADRDPANSE